MEVAAAVGGAPLRLRTVLAELLLVLFMQGQMAVRVQLARRATAARDSTLAARQELRGATVVDGALPDHPAALAVARVAQQCQEIQTLRGSPRAHV
jgi:hypothetical protein